MPHTIEPLADRELIDFGDLPEAINNLLQRGVAAYRNDPSVADSLFRQALALAPQQLPIYYCLYKIHTYQGNLDQALVVAEAGFEEAARQAGLSADYRSWLWPSAFPGDAERFALYTLKALAFIHLRRSERDKAFRILTELSRLDPSGTVGWRVVADLAHGLGSACLGG
jgi:tetratricopeptide (TPR) repeat protein